MEHRLLPKTDEGASDLLVLSLLSVAVISALMALDLYSRDDALLPLPKVLSLAPYFGLVPPSNWIN